ncbi:S-adenosyl-L-methionine-dependent methyltransferase [Fimicolochytrium jonesii]|uniref:S-adenosyl-L-methionine-dependent methyltransferase n=1 Tax=Fimicolochytrium jonesii TaxID=1396493 RepID=UPI0022FDDE13|nr:S-adenosyl-L-methionine-dependent methyltransferase [Fimicolochytrium jonesii]KAI8817471.1 S-adenosyl-L-methionine-dependent methyltransferase [Fimicolochytrium jonesii]
MHIAKDVTTSISKTRAKLRPLFTHLASIYTPTQLDALAVAFANPRQTTFRINTLKLGLGLMDGEGDGASSNEEGVKKREYRTNDKDPHHTERTRILSQLTSSLSPKHRSKRLTPAPFAPRTAFGLRNDAASPFIDVRHLAHLPVVKMGLVHFQGWSSMLPPLAAGVGRGERVLDMCAAPGGKTGMLVEGVVGSLGGSRDVKGARDGKGMVVANEIEHERAQRLTTNMDTLVPAHLRHLVHVQIKDGRKLPAFYNPPPAGVSPAPPSQQPQPHPATLFTSILLDAPCSGSGTIALAQPATYTHWTPTWVLKHARLQLQLLHAAHALLSPGGHLTYSTCTLSWEENEGVVSAFLAEAGDMKIVELAGGLGEMRDRGGEKAFSAGLAETKGERAAGGMEMALRVFPDELYEGFFVVRMQKGICEG